MMTIISVCMGMYYIIKLKYKLNKLNNLKNHYIPYTKYYNGL